MQDWEIYVMHDIIEVSKEVSATSFRSITPFFLPFFTKNKNGGTAQRHFVAINNKYKM